jgi:hypothetical protein
MFQFVLRVPFGGHPTWLATVLVLGTLAAAGPGRAQTVETPPAGPPPAPSASGAVVETTTLDSLDYFSAAGRRTGLGNDLWKGTSADLARSALPALGARPLEPGLSQLARQLLATGARGPDGAHEDADLAGERVLALIRLGDFEAARGVLARTPGVAAHARLSQAAAELALWSGDLERACTVGNALSEGRDGGFWLRLRALCLASAGKTAEAQLALELAAANPARDPALTRLVATLVNGGSPPPPSADTALAYAASRALKLDLASVVAPVPVPALLALASDEAQSPEVRRRAALRLIEMGADAAEVIRPVLLLATPPAAAAPAPAPAPEAVPLRKTRHGVHPRPAAPAAEPGPSEAIRAETMARLYAAARNAVDPAERARALTTLLRPAQGLSFRALSALVAPDLALVTPDGLSAEDRSLLALAAATVDAASAQPLRDSLTRDGPDAAPALTLSLIDAVRAVASPGRPVGEVLDRLVDAGSRATPADSLKAQGAAVILFGVGDPAGADLSPLARLQLSRFEPGPAHHVGPALVAFAAVARGAAGEVALLTLSAAGTDGSSFSPAERSLFLRPLTRAGLAAEARSIAVDGLLALAGR